MNEAIEWLKLYMDNNKTGNKVTDKYLEVVNALIESSIQLQQENKQLKQQLKDKDELLNKIKKMSEEYCSSKFIIQTYRLLHTEDERKFLESNKED